MSMTLGSASLFTCSLYRASQELFSIYRKKPCQYDLFCTVLALFLFVCGLTSLLNIWGHITTAPVCSRCTLTNVLPHRNNMPQTQDTTPHPTPGHRVDLSLCYPLMWSVTLEYTATHFNVLGKTRPGNPSQNKGHFHFKKPIYISGVHTKYLNRFRSDFNTDYFPWHG